MIKSWLTLLETCSDGTIVIGEKKKRQKWKDLKWAKVLAMIKAEQWCKSLAIVGREKLEIANSVATGGQPKMILIIPPDRGSSCCFQNCRVIWLLSNLFTARKRGILKTSFCQKSITYKHILQRLKYGLEYLWAGGGNLWYDVLNSEKLTWVQRRRSKKFDVSRQQ